MLLLRMVFVEQTQCEKSDIVFMVWIFDDLTDLFPRLFISVAYFYRVSVHQFVDGSPFFHEDIIFSLFLWNLLQKDHF